jgi:hypothetical protein
MLVLACCISIFITFISIFILLTYYFIKQRTLWNELFNINTIVESIMEMFVCPEHFILYIPGIVLETTECIKKTHRNNETELKIKLILTKINKCINKIELIEHDNDNNNNDNDNDNENDNEIKIIKWVLQGTMVNYNSMFKETATFYNKVSGSYILLNKETNKTKHNNNNKNNLITLETLTIIENNIEHCDTILNLLELITKNDYETLLEKENNYILYLLSKLLESIRMYKLKMYKLL